MLTLRCTRKLMRRLGVSADPEAMGSSTVLGDWYANVVYTQPHQLVLCMNERTLLVVLVPGRDIGHFADRFRESVLAHLRRLGVPPAAVQEEARAMSPVRFGATASRSILGCVREAEYALSFELQRPDAPSLTDLELFFSENIYSPTNYRYPRELVLEFFRAGGSAGARVHRNAL